MNLKAYFQNTRTVTYSVILALPLLVAYEVLIVLVNNGTDVPVRVGADVWIKQVIDMVGDVGMFVIGALLVVGGLWLVKRDRENGVPLRPRYFGWMLLESMLYAVVVAGIVSRLVGAIYYNIAPVALMASVQEIGLAKMLALSLGAGLYEELVFRVLLVGGLFWLFTRKKQEGSRRIGAYLLAAVIGAAIFSGVHYTGTFGDPFELPSFTFRFLFGLALNALYLWRGFGIAAWTHAIYDVLVVTNTL
ncbi:MAG: CPBP family intramembrane metalloprotease [Rhodothermales bacterium]|nr:CPBP family intramembrane metalloprotease [Rhodothermales bacterium]MBO6778207.1 CPBP family intramembrane metalloprotease [Rhodothermales bacterium]